VNPSRRDFDMPRSAPRYRLVFGAACVVLALYEMWTFFVREAPAVSIQGSHRRLVEEFGRGAPISQAFLMIGNGLRAIDVRFDADTPATLLMRCELTQIPTPGTTEPVVARAWFETVKRISGTEWRRLSFPAVEASNARSFVLRLQLIRAVAADGDPAAALMRAPADGDPRVAVLASKENVVVGGVLSIADRRQNGSLFLRAFTRTRTAYSRFRADVAPTLPGVLKNPIVELAILIVYQWALLTVIFSVLAGASNGAMIPGRHHGEVRP
jgi:hypothetical protein